MAVAGLTPAIRAFLEERRFAVIATINESGVPQLTTIWYELQGDEIMMNTAAGRLKDRNLRRDPRVTLCIEDEQRYLTLYGRVTLNDDQAQAQADINRLALRYDGPAQSAAQAASFGSQQRVTIRMTITHVHPHGFEE